MYGSSTLSNTIAASERDVAAAAAISKPSKGGRFRSFFQRRPPASAELPMDFRPILGLTAESSSAYAVQPAAKASATPMQASPSLPIRIPAKPTTTPGLAVWQSLSTEESRVVNRDPHRTTPKSVPEPQGRPDYNKGRVQGEDGIRRKAPEWYKLYPDYHRRGDLDFLCRTCVHIDLDYLFHRSEPRRTAAPAEYISLGPLETIVKESQDCVLCRIVLCAIVQGMGPEQDIQQSEEDRLFAADWYLSPFVYSHEQYGPGYQLFLRPDVFDAEKRNDTAHLHPSYPFGFRLMSNAARSGRRIPPDQLDFKWIKSTIEFCELSTDMPARNFARQVRVIDTQTMRIVNLSHDDRYIALSYPWGKVAQLKLTHQTLNFFRTPQSLSQVFRQLPRTIQDAITLVQKVGERYLWLDCLCILQDDEIDVRQQMKQMGTLYAHAYFTIFAISGQDANYGLPRVRPAPRKCKQVVMKIGDLSVANILPWMEEEDLLSAGAWGSRGWTFQERFKAQRGVFIGDQGVIINCMHTYSPEDEHCFHKITRDEDMIAKGTMFFYAGPDKRCEPFIRDETEFDTFTILVSEYTQRHLTYQTDALAAFLGVQDTIEGKLSCKLIHGHPEGEFDAALLWSPVGSSIRRWDPVAHKPLFPSWSWLGWVGHAAWPWQMERDAFVSTVNSTLAWQDAAAAAKVAYSSPEGGVWEFKHLLGSLNKTGTSVASHWSAADSWFTSDDLCLPDTNVRERVLQHWRTVYEDHLGIQMLCNACRKHPNYANRPAYHWPPEQAPKWKYALPGSHRLRFRTMCADLYVVGRPFRRKRLFNMQHEIWRLAVVDKAEKLAG
jgi:Heterokaryon incompatibility protein (HET)